LLHLLLKLLRLHLKLLLLKLLLLNLLLGLNLKLNLLLGLNLLLRLLRLHLKLLGLHLKLLRLHLLLGLLKLLLLRIAHSRLLALISPPPRPVIEVLSLNPHCRQLRLLRLLLRQLVQLLPYRKNHGPFQA
jgi:hypothetical protein